MAERPIRVLFVCLGNICRSPMGEGVMKMHLKKCNLSHRFEVDSAGTAGYHVGEQADPRTLAVLDQVGAPRPGLSRRVSASDFTDFDWILAMDQANYSTLLSRAPADAHANIVMALEPAGGGDVPDPYYGGVDGFDTVFSLLDQSVGLWVERMLESN